MDTISAKMQLLTVTELAEFLRVAPRTIYNRMYRCPETLPPAIYLKGFRGPRWVAERVFQWTVSPMSALPQPSKRRRRVGRPTKAEGISRRIAAAD